MATSLKVGPQDRVSIIISGVKGTGAGRSTRQVDHSQNLAEFLEKYGEGEKDVQMPDFDNLKALGKAGDSAALTAALGKLSADLMGSAAKPLPQRIVDATCKLLVAEYDFVIADSDPGSDNFYISAGDLTPQMVSVPNDGNEWHVVAAAPFGA